MIQFDSVFLQFLLILAALQMASGDDDGPDPVIGPGYIAFKKLSDVLNLHEPVAFGDAVQGALLSREDNVGYHGHVQVLDVNPLTLGIETSSGTMTKIIPRNSAIPNIKKETFSTAADNQPTVTINVYEGEEPMVKNNKLLGKFDLTPIPPAPK